MLESTREVTAHHEAGHAVAVVMRGGQLHYIDLTATDEYRGYTHFSSKSCDSAFIIYGGLFAEARVKWPLADLDGEDDDGCTFPNYVWGALSANIDGDNEAYKAALDSESAAAELAPFQPRREQVWRKELERVWPVIREVARLRLADGADMYHGPDHRTWHDTIEQLLEDNAMTYAETWADAINQTYTDPDETFCGQDFDHDDVREVLTKAADCLRDGATHTFTGGELDLVRHLMPAHEVHQSGAKRFLLEFYGG
jgi:hypothetical protein